MLMEVLVRIQATGYRSGSQRALWDRGSHWQVINIWTEQSMHKSSAGVEQEEGDGQNTFIGEEEEPTERLAENDRETE